MYVQFCYRCPCYNYNYHSIKRAGRFLVVAYIIILDCFVLEAFREYRDDLRDHMSDNSDRPCVADDNTAGAV